MAQGDLTTLAHTKQWLGITTDGSDALLSLMIAAASRFVLGYLGRPSLAATDYTEDYDGYGNNFMSLRQWPVISLSSIGFYGTTITQASTGNPRSNGYILSAEDNGPSRVTLWGNSFPRGRSAISIAYRAGYVTRQCGDVPATPFKITTDRVWLADEGVHYEDGVALVRVDESPAVGEYAVVDGVYEFNTADSGESVCIDYSYVPADIEQAVYQMVGEQFKYRDRIGVKSKSLSGGVGETVSFSETDMTPYLSTLLQPYRRVV